MRVRREAWFPEDTGTGGGRGAAEPTLGVPPSAPAIPGKEVFSWMDRAGNRHVDSCSSAHEPLERSVAGPRERRSFRPGR